MIDPIKLDKDNQEAIIARYIALEAEYDSFEADNIREAKEDLAMENGDQKDPKIEAERGKDRPYVVINKLSSPCKRISNEFRQNTIGIKINAQNLDAKVKVKAKVRQGLARKIESMSNAQTTYASCFDLAVRSGFGFYRILADYKSPTSRDQELFVAPIRNNFSVKMDFRRDWVWGHDAKWCIIKNKLSMETFKREFPDSDMAREYVDISKYDVERYNGKEVVVDEFYDVQYEPDTLLFLKDGRDVLKSKFDGKVSELLINKKTKKPESRPTQIPRVHWYKLTCHEVLEHSIIPIKYIPIICMPGDVAQVEEKRYLRSLIRQAKGPQKSYNLNRSNAQEKNNLSPKAPFTATVKQIGPYKDMYEHANVRNYAVLPYIGDPDANGPPQRQGYVNMSAGDERMAMEDAEEIKQSTGIYDSALGAQSNETTGVAIRARSGQSQTVNYNFHANAASAIQYGAQIINDWMQYVYDGERIVSILGEDMREEIVTLNSQDPNDPLSRFYEDDEIYDVTVETGPAYQTQMQEAYEMISGLLKDMTPEERSITYPKLMANLNFQGAKELQDQLQALAKMRYPQLFKEDKTNLNQNPEEALKQEVEQANQALDEQGQVLQQYGQVIDQLQAQVQQLTDVSEKEMRLEKVRHENLMEEKKFQADVDFKLQEMKANAEFDKALLADQIAKSAVIAQPVNASAPAYAEADMQQEYAENAQEDQSMHQMPDGSMMNDMMMMNQQEPQQESPEMGVGEQPENVLAQTPGNESPDMEQM